MADELKLETAPTSKRFPTTNQAKACYMCALRPPLRRCRTHKRGTLTAAAAFTSPVCRRALLIVPPPRAARYYNSWHQCKFDFSEEEPNCAQLKGWAMSMCPAEWVEKWEAQRESGTYPGPVPGEKKEGNAH